MHPLHGIKQAKQARGVHKRREKWAVRCHLLSLPQQKEPPLTLPGPNIWRLMAGESNEWNEKKLLFRVHKPFGKTVRVPRYKGLICASKDSLTVTVQQAATL